MNFFTFDVRKVFLILAVVVGPLVIINMQRNSDETILVLRPFTMAAHFSQSTYSSFSSGVRGTVALYLDLVGIKKEIQSLQNENIELRAQLGSMSELKLENERLNSLLSFQQKTKMQLLAAKVIGRDLLPDRNTLVINRGTQHGIKKNMGTLTVGGAVGYILQAEPFTSRILLLNDRYSVIDSIVQRSRAAGLVEGSRTFLKLEHLQRSDDVQIGDLVVTSGLDNYFPKGFPIGSVVKVEKSQYGMSQKVELRPSVNPFTLEEVFVVLNANSEDFTPGGTSL